MIGKIYISGLIGTFGEEKGVELLDVISQVKKQPTATSFEVYINSEGGVVDTGFDIYNFLKSLGLPITTIGTGMVASIATIIFMAGNKRIVKPNTQFMIHLPMGGIDYATADEMELHSKEVRNVENKIIQFYSKELNLNKEAVTPLLRNETWLTADQLTDLGFVTSQSQIKIAARAIINNKSNTKKMSKKNNILKTLLMALKGETLNKVIYSADSKELVFADLGEDDPIEVGAKATLDGVPVGGTAEEPVEVVGQDGRTYVFIDSAVSEIIEVVAEEEEEEMAFNEDQFIEALIATLEVASDLEERVGSMEVETVAIKAERDDFKAKLATATATIAKLKGSSKAPETDVKDKDEKVNTVSSTVAQWKKSKQLKNK